MALKGPAALTIRNWVNPLMTNANNARLTRISTRAPGGSISSELPLTASEGNRFEVVVEGIAGRVLATSGQPYALRISALDLTTGANPHSAANNFSQQRLEQFDAVHGWPEKLAAFPITVGDLPAVQGHLFRYYAILLSANQIISFTESPLFVLLAYGSRPRVAQTHLDSTAEEVSQPPSGGTRMNANDARIVRLFTTTDGGSAEDNTPNEVGGTKNGAFDLILQAEAGSVIGNSGATYKVRLSAFDLSAGVAVPAADLLPATPAFPSDEQFDSSTAGNKNNWQAAGADFVKNQRYKVTIGAGAKRGNVHQYTASLVSNNFQVVAIAQSNLFILV